MKHDWKRRLEQKEEARAARLKHLEAVAAPFEAAGLLPDPAPQTWAFVDDLWADRAGAFVALLRAEMDLLRFKMKQEMQAQIYGNHIWIGSG
jgi:hypothetical protein